MKTTGVKTMTYLRKHGYTVGKVEYWGAFDHKRHDLFGIIDIIAIKQGSGVIGVQTTSDSHRSDHRKKMLAEPRARDWVDAGGVLWLVTWGKKQRGNRMLWVPHFEDFAVNDDRFEATHFELAVFAGIYETRGNKNKPKPEYEQDMLLHKGEKHVI